MKAYLSVNTIHLRPSCRRTEGVEIELDVFIHHPNPLVLSGDAADCKQFRMSACKMCLKYLHRQSRVKDMARLKEGGLTLQRIGDVYGVSRQYVHQLLKEVR